MSPQTLQSLVKAHAQDAGLDPALVCAVVEQESSWNPWAIRFEPAFKRHYIDPLNLDNLTEEVARSISWGLMQVMGEVAREKGFKGPLPSLCDPETGIAVGISHLASKLKAAGGNVSKALLLWNGGSNPNYPSQVLARKSKYES